MVVRSLVQRSCFANGDMRVEPAIGPAAPSRRFTFFWYNRFSGELILKSSRYHPEMHFPRGRATEPRIEVFGNGLVWVYWQTPK